MILECTNEFGAAAKLASKPLLSSNLTSPAPPSRTPAIVAHQIITAPQTIEPDSNLAEVT